MLTTDVLGPKWEVVEYNEKSTNVELDKKFDLARFVL